MAGRSDSIEIDAVLQEMRHAEPRSAILVGASLLESTLELAIGAKLREAKSETEAGFLFDDQRGVFSNFERKIWGAFFLTIVGPQTRADIDIVRRIRNDCAHNMKQVSFEVAPISDRCRSFNLLKRNRIKDRAQWRGTHLSVVKPKDESPCRDKYLYVVVAISSGLIARSVFSPAEENAEAIKNWLQAVVDP